MVLMEIFINIVVRKYSFNISEANRFLLLLNKSIIKGFCAKLKS